MSVTDETALAMGRLSALQNIRTQLGLPLISAPSDREPELKVAYASGTAGVCGHGLEHVAYCRVSLDEAHDLSRQGPRAFVEASMGDHRGVLEWRVGVLAFTEHEATDTFVAVRSALDGV